MQSRSINITDVFHALVTIRDRIITDENLTTCKRVIDTMTTLLAELINGISQEELVTLENEFTSRGLITEYTFLQEILQNSFVKSLKSMTTSITVDGIIDAIKFIQTHLKTTVSLLDDVKDVLSSLDDIKTYQETSSEQSSRTLQDGTFVDDELFEMYKEFFND